MSVWFAIPSARPPAEAEERLSKWRAQGYKLAIWRDHPESVDCDLEARGDYTGYYGSINLLTKHILAEYPDAEWIVTGGDDMEPDAAHRAEEIAAQCRERFGGTLGVMQPIGDRWGHNGHIYAERVAGSPWMGREWCQRAYRGQGPMWQEYWHYYGDESLQVVATRLDLFWQRKDLIHFHHHYMRKPGAPIPAFHANAARRFQSDGLIFQRRKAANFPGYELAV